MTIFSSHAIAEFHRRFPMQAALRGTSRTWLSTTIETTGKRVEALANPAISA
ncbi:hypothetical protein [Streptomyces wuyuanensis]|uniref:hypothetical protein n=1 Tax=Streptomyces wuyuanensis TaxID=1196353 RepID=UPI0036B9E689